MKFEYVPLLRIQRDLQELPRDYKRFKQYLDTIFKHDTLGIELPPLVAMNPMGKDHVTRLLDEFLALDADTIAGEAACEASRHLVDEPWDIKAGLVISDDLAGGWTNRFACEFGLRFGPDHLRFQSNRKHELPRWLSHFWITGVVWSSEPATAESPWRWRRCASDSVCATARPARTRGHDAARGASAAGARADLDADDLDYTREMIQPYLDANDCRHRMPVRRRRPYAGFTPRRSVGRHGAGDV